MKISLFQFVLLIIIFILLFQTKFPFQKNIYKLFHRFFKGTGKN